MVNIGDVINGYKILKEFTPAGAGLCRWTFAEKEGKEFFIKEFLSPKYPIEGSPGSETVKAQKRERCRLFEERHQKLQNTLEGSTSSSGNLVITVDFFREGTTYYKVTEKVESVPMSDIVYKLPLKSRISILKNIAHSLSILHQFGIVHGDLKPDNILLTEQDDEKYIAKIIDFDDSYFSSYPPEDVVGDPVYYSPELGRYIRKIPPVLAKDLNVRSDIFALGIIYSQYLTGKFPYSDADSKYIWESKHQPYIITDDVKIPFALEQLINRMLSIEPTQRPPIKEIYKSLNKLEKIIDDETVISDSVRDEVVRLKGRGMRTTIIPEEKPIPRATGSRLKGRLVTK